MAEAREVNFDGLVGPTHNYAGLSLGNVASMAHAGGISNPRAAALQGLAKMRFLAELGVPQAVLPPHLRPDVDTLRRFGFTGEAAAVLRSAARNAPELLRACTSASSMWVANAATVTPSIDAQDNRVHFTPANLISKLHRSIEPPQTMRTLRAIFSDPTRFTIHDPVPGAEGLGDEGAANHTRLATSHGTPGLHLFVYGHHAFAHSPRTPAPQRFSSRQAAETAAAVARCHLLNDDAVRFAQQHPAAIDAGVFHNDVISVGNENVFLYHERAFANTRGVIADLHRRYRALNKGAELMTIPVAERRVPLAAAVRSYLFNSQLVTVARAEQRMALIAPDECREIPSVHQFLGELISRGHTPIREIHFLNLRQSMRNGGGPACLRLRVVLTADEWNAVNPGVRFDSTLHDVLVAWVNRHYRERLSSRDLADPTLLEESRRALDGLTQMLHLGSIYPFQRV